MLFALLAKTNVPDASPLYKKQGATVYSTRALGTITVSMWNDGEVWIEAGTTRLATLPPIAQKSMTASELLASLAGYQ